MTFYLWPLFIYYLYLSMAFILIYCANIILFHIYNSQAKKLSDDVTLYETLEKNSNGPLPPRLRIKNPP